MSPVPPEQVDQVGYYLRRIFRCLDRDLAFLLSQEGLTFPQMVVLRYIRAKDGTTLAELARLCNGGQYVIRNYQPVGARRPDHAPADPADLRIYRLRITAKAEAILGKTYRTYNDHLGCI